MTDGTTVVLCGGGMNYQHLPVATTTSNALMPVNGKPVIAWVLEDLAQKGVTNIRLVIRNRDEKLVSYVTRAFVDVISTAIVTIQDGGSILTSLHTALTSRPISSPIRIVLGDTLIRETYEGREDFLYVGAVDDSARWCIAEVDSDNRIVSYTDKKELPGGVHNAVAGFYHLMDADLLLNCVSAALEEGETELSAVLRRYSETRAIFAKPTRNWYDFGHIDHLVEARSALLRPRHFNTVSVNTILGTLTKTSSNGEKLRDELDWYLSIPETLRSLTPRIIESAEVNGRLMFVQEFYGYPTLAELYVYGDLDADTWKSILRKVFRIHSEFERIPGYLSRADVLGMYTTKTLDRLEQLSRMDDKWREFIESGSTLEFNGSRLQSIGTLKDSIVSRSEDLMSNLKISVIHGDFCYSNILFDTNHQIVRLIDPRGRFGKKGIWGDPRYDVAKLRHSAKGLYDFIVADAFEITGSNGRYVGGVHCPPTTRKAAEFFDNFVANAGYDVNEIKFIEGLLFVSMTPLHSDNPRRQLLMMLVGLQLLNEVLR